MRDRALVILLTLYVRLVGWTSGISYAGAENLPPPPFIYAFWHNRLLLMTYIYRGRNIKVLASTSRDGEIAARVALAMGYRFIRGTASDSESGRRSVRMILRRLKRGSIIAIMPDGPRGPAGAVKPGAAFIARLSGCPIVPISCSAKRKRFLKTWDRFMLPFPFNRCVAVTGKPVYVKKDEEIGQACLRIKAALDGAAREADRKALEL